MKKIYIKPEFSKALLVVENILLISSSNYDIISNDIFND